MNRKQKIRLLVGLICLVASPFLGLSIAPLLHPLTCQPGISGRLQIFQCSTGDFYTWVVSGSVILTMGVVLLLNALSVKKTKKTNKDKPLLMIPWTKRLKTPVTKKGIERFTVILMAVGLIVGTGIALNVLPFAYAVVHCGKLPVESSKFMADYSYRLPDDKGYGIHAFSEYQFCTQEEIVATNGYHRDVNTDAAKAETEANRLKSEEAARFDPKKVDYQVYLPVREGFEAGNLSLSKMSDGDMQTFFGFSKPGTKTGFGFREGKIPSSYELCKGTEYRCEAIGHDKQGNIIRKQIAGTAKNPIVYYSINLGKTFINIGQGAYTAYSDEEMIGVFNSLIPYGN